MNKEHLYAARDAFLAEGKAFTMDEFGDDAEKPTCETPMCIAGWGCWLSLGHMSHYSGRIVEEAKKYFELDEEQAERLFYVSDWVDAAAQDAYYTSKTNQDRANAAGGYIDTFIAFYGGDQ